MLLKYIVFTFVFLIFAPQAAMADGVVNGMADLRAMMEVLNSSAERYQTPNIGADTDIPSMIKDLGTLKVEMSFEQGILEALLPVLMSTANTPLAKYRVSHLANIFHQTDAKDAKFVQHLIDLGNMRNITFAELKTAVFPSFTTNVYAEIGFNLGFRESAVNDLELVWGQINTP